MHFRGSLVSSGMRALEVGHLGKKLNFYTTEQLRDWNLRAVEKKINAVQSMFPILPWVMSSVSEEEVLLL